MYKYFAVKFYTDLLNKTFASQLFNTFIKPPCFVNLSYNSLNWLLISNSCCLPNKKYVYQKKLKLNYYGNVFYKLKIAEIFVIGWCTIIKYYLKL